MSIRTEWTDLAVSDGTTMRAFTALPAEEAEFGDADHGFFCDQRPSYSPADARVAWPLLLAFLREHLG